MCLGYQKYMIRLIDSSTLRTTSMIHDAMMWHSSFPSPWSWTNPPCPFRPIFESGYLTQLGVRVSTCCRMQAFKIYIRPRPLLRPSYTAGDTCKAGPEWPKGDPKRFKGASSLHPFPSSSSLPCLTRSTWQLMCISA